MKAIGDAAKEIVAAIEGFERATATELIERGFAVVVLERGEIAEGKARSRDALLPRTA
jgi:hypothetical protein